MIKQPARRRWISLLMLVTAAALLLALLAPVNRRALASVTLNYFRATWQPELETIVIEWQTATELNTVGFIIERSTMSDGVFTAITELIPAVGDPLGGWTYDPVADDPDTLVIGTTYWYRMIVINTSPPNDTIDPVSVKAGEPNTLTPTNTATPTATTTRTRTPTPSATSSSSSTQPTAISSAGTPIVTPSVTFVSIAGATVTPRPPQASGATATSASAALPAARTATPSNLPPIVLATEPVGSGPDSPLATPQTVAQSQLPVAAIPTSVPPTLVPTNATIVAVAPIVVADDSTSPADAAADGSGSSVVVLIAAAALLLLGGGYAILRQTNK